jgi:acid phosphatase
LFSGSTQGITDNSCPHNFHGPNLANSLIDAGFTFAGYSESLPAAGSGTCESGAYARKHNPWVNFSNVPRAVNLPFTRFPAAFDQLPDLCFVVPNENNNMHDGTVATGDAWLRQHIAAYAQWAMANNSLLILTQDEGPNGGDNRVFTLFVGPMVRPGQYSEPINHYTLLRTLLAMYDLAPIGHSADKVPITSCWDNGLGQHADHGVSCEPD